MLDRLMQRMELNKFCYNKNLAAQADDIGFLGQAVKERAPQIR